MKCKYMKYLDLKEALRGINPLSDKFRNWELYDKFLMLAKSMQKENLDMCQMMFKAYLQEQEMKVAKGMVHFAGELYDVVHRTKNQIIFHLDKNIPSVRYRFRRYLNHYKRGYKDKAREDLIDFANSALFWGKNDTRGKVITFAVQSIKKTIRLISDAQYHNTFSGKNMPWFVCTSIKQGR